MTFLQKSEQLINAFFEKINQKHIVTAIIIFLANVLFKIVFLDHASLWLDEANHIHRSLHSFKEIFDLTIKGSNGPIYFYITHIWLKIFGSSVISARLLSVIFSSLSAVAVFYFARKFIDIKTAIFAVIIFTLSKIQFYYAHESRSYAYLTLLSILSFHYMFKMFQQFNYKNFVILTLVYLFIVHTHILFILVIPIQFYIALFKFKKNRKAFVYLLISQFFSVLTIVIWILANPWLGGNETTWGTVPDFNKLIEMFGTYSNSIINFYYLLFLLSVFFIALAHNYIKKIKIEYSSLVMLQNLILWGFLPVMAIYLLSVYYNPRFIPRYMLYATPGLYLLMAFLINKFKVHSFVKFGLLGVFVYFSLLGFNLNPGKGENWKQAINHMETLNLEKDSTLVIILPWSQFPCFSYYFDNKAFKDYRNTQKLLKEQNVFLTSNSLILDKIDFTNFKNVALFTSQEGVYDPERKLYEGLKNKFSLVDIQNRFPGVKFYLFNTKNKSNTVYDILDFENPDDSKTIKADSNAFSGNYVCALNDTLIYSPGFKAPCKEILQDYLSFITLEAWVKYDNENVEANLVFSIENDAGSVLWKSLKINNSGNLNEWQFISYGVEIPEYVSDEDILKAYIWNNGKTNLWIDDFKLIKHERIKR